MVVKRARIAFHPFQGFSPPEIAGLALWSEDWVRRVITDYSRMGRDAVYAKKSPGPERKLTPEIRKAVVGIAPPDSGTFVGKRPLAGRST